MGLFILPPRLIRELKEVKDILTSNATIDAFNLEKFNLGYQNMIKELIDNHGNNLSESEAEKVIKHYINNVCRNILINTAVFKNDENGRKYFDELMDLVG